MNTLWRITSPFITLLIYSFVLRLLSETFHSKRKNKTFRRADRSKMISLQDVPRIPVTEISPRLPCPWAEKARKILPVLLRTNQTAGFVTVPSWKKKIKKKNYPVDLALF